MPTVRAANSEPIPGYRLLEPLGFGGFGEVWKCEAPGGLFKAIKFVPGPGDALGESGGGARRELQALQHIKTIRHPFLLALDRVEMVAGDLVVVMELADKSLHDLLMQYRQAGRLGVPRDELLGYLREAAEVLDLMNREHQLQHLDVKPRNLFLVHQHVKVADFGLVGDLGVRPDTRMRESVTPLYAAPETFLGKITPFCDQYSLAVTYQELLTGILPFTGKNFRQLAMAHVQGVPDLNPLPEADRPVIARALAKEPTQRFPSCLEFVAALQAAAAGPLPAVRRPRSTAVDLVLGELSHTPVTAETASPARPPRPATVPPAGSSLVSGHQLLECVGRLHVGEAWKARSPDGFPRLIKLVLAPEAPPDAADIDPVALLQSLRHDSLVPLQIAPCPGNRLALISDPCNGALFDHLKELQNEGLPGIGRTELLELLHPVAEALDELYQTYRLQHLGLTPRQLVLDRGRVRILDYGLMELLWIPAGFEAPAVNTRYCAPELFARQSSRACDQYSLALIYQELLTGVHAFRNLNPRQMANAKLRGNPDVGLLPSTDRRIVLRALHLDPDQRFGSCAEFIAALEEVARSGAQVGSSRRTQVCGVVARPTMVVPTVAGAGQATLPDTRQPSANELRKAIAAEVAAAAPGQEFLATGSLRYALSRGESGEPLLESHCFGRLVPGTVHLKLQGFREQWRAEVRTAAGPSSPETGAVIVFFIPLSTSLWQRAIGRQAGLEVRLELRIAATEVDRLTEVAVYVRPQGCASERGEQALIHDGPRILESLRSFLQLHTERRAELRVPYPVPLHVQPILPQGQLGEPILAQGKDLTPGGIGLYLPCRPTSPDVYVHLSPAQHAPFVVPARVVHYRPCPDGHFEMGLCFAWDEV